MSRNSELSKKGKTDPIRMESYWHSCHQGGSEHRAVSFTSFFYFSGLRGTEAEKLIDAVIQP